jgi:putative transposase
MPKKRFTAEEIIHKLREAEVLAAQGREASSFFRVIRK